MLMWSCIQTCFVSHNPRWVQGGEASGSPAAEQSSSLSTEKRHSQLVWQPHVELRQGIHVLASCFIVCMIIAVMLKKKKNAQCFERSKLETWQKASTRAKVQLNRTAGAVFAVMQCLAPVGRWQRFYGSICGCKRLLAENEHSCLKGLSSRWG